jgi:hypothetical protein
MKVLSVTPAMARTFDKWIAVKGFDAARRYFSFIAGQLVLVTDDGMPTLNWLNVPDEFPEADQGVDPIRAHMLDDPRDDYSRWEDTQPPAWRAELKKLRSAKTLDELSVIAKSYYGSKARFSNIQMSVLWDEYRRMKARLTPRLGKRALKWLERLSAPGVKIGKAKYELYNDSGFEAHEKAVLWATIKEIEKKSQLSLI